MQMTNDGEEKDIIRASVTSIANSWRPPKRCNITTAQEKALKSPAEDPSVPILPVDKGKCVVVIILIRSWNMYKTRTPIKE